MNKIVIVGAGPTGITLAWLLTQQGIAVTLIEAAPDFARTFRGEGLMPSGLAALEQMGLFPLAPDIPNTCLDGWEVILNGRSLFKVTEPFTTNEQPCTLISQPHFLESVLTKLLAYDNFQFISGKPVRDLIKGDREQVIGVSLGKQDQIYADLVVGADGRNSLIRQKAGILLQKSASAINILWFQLETESEAQVENIFYSIVQDSSAFGIFRSSLGNLHLALAIAQETKGNWKQIDWREKLIAIAPDWLTKILKDQQVQLSKPLLLSVQVGHCSQWHKPGIILLGDAAHPMSPIRAQGINMALRDALVASNYLIPQFLGKINDQSLDQALSNIEAERKPEIIKIQKLQQAEIAQAEKLRHSQLLRSLVFNFAPVLSPIIRFSWLHRQKQMRQGITTVKKIVT